MARIAPILAATGLCCAIPGLRGAHAIVSTHRYGAIEIDMPNSRIVLVHPAHFALFW
ncbi:hypothetical protein BDSB_06665 [Burkholderia dolosa PC543]|nr:hypothetical protein BDSB_06665 [Burkholderia dolosa PC543]